MNPKDNVQAAFRRAGLYHFAADSLLCQELADAALDRRVIRDRLAAFLRTRGMTLTEPFIDAAADAIAGVTA